MLETSDFDIMDVDGGVEIRRYLGHDSNVVIPSSINGKNVISIGRWAFYLSDYGDSVKSVTAPDTVTEIGTQAFENCESLENIILSDNLVEIGSRAFCNTGLTGITIPAGVSTIDSSAFENCMNLKSIKVESGNNVYFDSDDVLYIKEEDGAVSLHFCPKVKTGIVTVPDGVTEIGAGSFADCTEITKVIIPESVTKIGFGAFENCTNITEVIIPESVTEIESCAFENCANITEVIIPKSVTEIESSTFENCTKITEVIIPEGVTEIGSNAFENCIGIKSLVLPDSAWRIWEDSFKGCENITVTYLGSTYDYSNIDSIYNAGFIMNGG